MTSNRITSEEFLRFNEQLLALTRARIPLDRGLREMAAEIKNERLRNYTGKVAHGLEQGKQLSEAIEPVSPAATEYYLTLLKAGERAGSLAEVLHHIVAESRRRIDHRRAILTSLIYPAGVFVFATVVLYFISVYVVPTFVDIFAQLGAELPEPTEFVISMFEFIRINLVFVVAGLGVIVAVVLAVARFRPLRPLRDTLLLNMPLIGAMVYNDTIISFCRSLGFLLDRKVPMPDALFLTRSTIDNAIAQNYVEKLRERVEQGESLGEAMDEHDYLPTSTDWMIHLSEDRGDLPQTLLDLADFYQDRQNQLRSAVQGVIEPFVIGFLGIVIGLLIVTLYLPLFTIPKVIR